MVQYPNSSMVRVVISSEEILCSIPCRGRNVTLAPELRNTWVNGEKHQRENMVEKQHLKNGGVWGLGLSNSQKKIGL